MVATFSAAVAPAAMTLAVTRTAPAERSTPAPASAAFSSFMASFRISGFRT
eukprot:CAMPEP_0194398370 /NCGR_PEP_ID=MMETSP0174-20130528/126063_1 /TAXON_ID=216777 /ORGANISM="Proboscia alata, Strain PI-D3" /LENGTH=50 /DNA_ID=CAMNT_0039194653 /DNA_START=754 /DNA_END=906 /DNA_ORIENTATION=-